MIATSLLLLLAASPASATVTAECEGTTQKFESEAEQANFLLNYNALATTFSPLHSPVPQAHSKVSAGLELSVFPPLSCEQRLVLNSTKEEDTNKTPILPRPRILFTLPKLGKGVTAYGGFAFLPPVPMFGVRTLLVSTELGIGVGKEKGTQLGGRFHSTVIKTIGEVAGPFEEDGEIFDDLYIGSTLGVDFMGGYGLPNGFTPYVALGLTDVSTFFYIGDDGYVGNNTDPFFGPVASLGTDYASGNWTFAGEFYTAPGFTYTKESLDPDDSTFDGWHHTEGGYINTARFKAAYVF